MMKITGDISGTQRRSQMGGMLAKHAGEGIYDGGHVPAGGAMTQQQREPLRTDAQQNRKRILLAAHEALAVSSDASLNSIAKMAGVGPGTLYRHFPNREALVLAVYRHDVQQLADSAPELLRQHEPVTALRLWFDRLAHYGRIKHGLADVLHAATSDGLAGETYGPVIGAISLLLKACEQAGRIQPGVDPDDVLLLMGFLWRIDANEDGEARAARLLDLVMNGLVTRAPASKPIARGRWLPWPRGHHATRL